MCQRVNKWVKSTVSESGTQRAAVYVVICLLERVPRPSKIQFRSPVSGKARHDADGCTLGHAVTLIGCSDSVRKRDIDILVKWIGRRSCRYEQTAACLN